MGNMKANRKFKEEKAVSAVIGVILMVAITVAIAATVFVYVSGMMTPTTTGKIMSASPVGSSVEHKEMQFKVTSADAGIVWDQCTLAWANGTAPNENLTSTAPTGGALGTAMAGNIAVGQYFYIYIGKTGTYAVDIIFGGKIIWTSASFVIS